MSLVAETYAKDTFEPQVLPYLPAWDAVYEGNYTLLALNLVIIVNRGLRHFETR